MSFAEKNPEFGGSALEPIWGFSTLRLFSLQGPTLMLRVVLIWAKQVVLLIGLVLFQEVSVSDFCQEITSYLLQFSQAFHFSAEFLPGTDSGHCSVLLNSCSVPHLSGPPSILEKKTTLNQKRVFYSPSVKHCSPYLSLQGSLREFSPKIHLNMYCSFSSSVPAAARIHTHSHHIFCLSVGTVVLPAWVLLQSHGEEGGKLPCFLSDGVW